MSRKWSEDSMMAFVRAYEQEPTLWDPSHDGYRSKAARCAALQRIVVAVNVENFTTRECKVKIKNLRSHYWQEVAKIQRDLSSGAPPAERYKPTVAWFNTVDRFLRNVVIQNSNTNFDKEMRKPKFEEQEVDFDSDSSECKSQHGSSFSDSCRRAASNGSPAHRDCRRHRDPPPAKRPRSPDTEDARPAKGSTEFDLWAMSVARQLNGMAPRRALALQLKLQTLLTQERIHYYDSIGAT